MTSAKRILALPLILLALLAQGMAPAAAAVMTVRMAEPLANLPICSTSIDGHGDTKAPPSPHQQVCDACSVCAGPAASVTPYAPALVPPMAVRVVARPAVQTVGPRGPPLLVPRARGPPAQA